MSGVCAAHIRARTPLQYSASTLRHRRRCRYDCGRFIQQSYYGCEDGSDWPPGRPWRWNPVQCGSWQNAPARVLKCALEGGRITTEVQPRNWAGQQLLEDVVMRSDINIASDHIHIRFGFQYSGSTAHPVRIQELPAVFVSRRLGQLVFYDGPEPWQGKALQHKTPGPTNGAGKRAACCS